jgi:regulator of chromosome condensation (RCC1) repeat-containing protein
MSTKNPRRVRVLVLTAVVSLLSAGALPLNVTAQPVALPAVSLFAAGNAVGPGTVTVWGNGNSNPTPVSFPSPVTTVSGASAGSFGDVAITDDGVYTWGNHPELVPPGKVVFPPAVTRVSAVSAGTGHILAVTNDGLYAWGSNASGQLGDGTTTMRTSPVKVSFPATVASVSSIAAGAYHSLAITNDGLYAWGSNGGAQLGDGTRSTRTLPVKVALPPVVTSVVAISGGGFHSLAITNDGAYAWGNNTFGQLGDGTTVDSNVPLKTVFAPPSRRAKRDVSPVTSVTAVSAGFWHSLEITNDGLYGFGYNGNGELGLGTRTTYNPVPARAVFAKAVTTITSVSAGVMHSLATTNDGLYAWGNNSQGQLGISSGGVASPTRVPSEGSALAAYAGDYHSVALH